MVAGIVKAAIDAAITGTKAIDNATSSKGAAGGTNLSPTEEKIEKAVEEATKESDKTIKENPNKKIGPDLPKNDGEQKSEDKTVAQKLAEGGRVSSEEFNSWAGNREPREILKEVFDAVPPDADIPESVSNAIYKNTPDEIKKPFIDGVFNGGDYQQLSDQFHDQILNWLTDGQLPKVNDNSTNDADDIAQRDQTPDTAAIAPEDVVTNPADYDNEENDEFKKALIGVNQLYD